MSIEESKPLLQISPHLAFEHDRKEREMIRERHGYTVDGSFSEHSKDGTNGSVSIYTVSPPLVSLRNSKPIYFLGYPSDYPLSRRPCQFSTAFDYRPRRRHYSTPANNAVPHSVRAIVLSIFRSSSRFKCADRSYKEWHVRGCS